MGEWKEIKIKDITSYRKSKVEVSNLNDRNYISTENMLPNKKGVQKSNSLPRTQKTSEFKNGDILVSNIRPYFKKIWRATFDGGCSNDVLVFSSSDDVIKEYLYYVLSSDDFFEYMMLTSKGTKMPRGDKKMIMEYKIPSHTVCQQRKIALILQKIDKKIELNNRINDNLAHQRMHKDMRKTQKLELASIFAFILIAFYMSATSNEPKQSEGEVESGRHSLVA